MKNSVHPIEHLTLSNQHSSVYDNSRLACGIKLKPWMNEMIVTQVRALDPVTHDVVYDPKIEELRDLKCDSTSFIYDDSNKKKE